MGLLTFKGGVHPNDGKSLAKDKAIVELLPQGDLVYPLSQHIGAPAKPVVAKGDHVLKGQKIAEAGGFVSAPIYASVSGTVKAIEPRVNPTGSKVNSIIIANDGQYEEVEYPQPKPLSELTKEEILNIIGEAGVVGMGGAGFPTRVKLSPKEPDKIDYIIANCAECEPYITADYRRMLENPELLVEGMRVILKLFDNAKGLFAIEDNKPDCIAKLKELTSYGSQRDDDQVPTGRRTSADFCKYRTCDQFYHASGRCWMCSRQRRDHHQHLQCSSKRHSFYGTCRYCNRGWSCKSW